MIVETTMGAPQPWKTTVAVASPGSARDPAGTTRGADWTWHAAAHSSGSCGGARRAPSGCRPAVDDTKVPAKASGQPRAPVNSPTHGRGSPAAATRRGYQAAIRERRCTGQTPLDSLREARPRPSTRRAMPCALRPDPLLASAVGIAVRHHAGKLGEIVAAHVTAGFRFGPRIVESDSMQKRHIQWDRITRCREL